MRSLYELIKGNFRNLLPHKSPSSHWFRLDYSVLFITSRGRQVVHRGRRGLQQAHSVGAEFPVLLGPAVRSGCALVQTEHELQVLIRFLLVGQRQVVVRSFVLCARVTPAAAPQRGVRRGHLLPGQEAGAGGAEQEDKKGQDADA